MQYAENLTRQQEANAVHSLIDWKYVLGLGLSDQDFHYSVLSEYRSQLIQGQAEHLLFEAMWELFKDIGLFVLQRNIGF